MHEGVFNGGKDIYIYIYIYIYSSIEHESEMCTQHCNCRQLMIADKYIYIAAALYISLTDILDSQSIPREFEANEVS